VGIRRIGSSAPSGNQAWNFQSTQSKMPAGLFISQRALVCAAHHAAAKTSSSRILQPSLFGMVQNLCLTKPNQAPHIIAFLFILYTRKGNKPNVTPVSYPGRITQRLRFTADFLPVFFVLFAFFRRETAIRFCIYRTCKISYFLP